MTPHIVILLSRYIFQKLKSFLNTAKLIQLGVGGEGRGVKLSAISLISELSGGHFRNALSGLSYCQAEGLLRGASRAAGAASADKTKNDQKRAALLLLTPRSGKLTRYKKESYSPKALWQHALHLKRQKCLLHLSFKDSDISIQLKIVSPFVTIIFISLS